MGPEGVDESSFGGLLGSGTRVRMTSDSAGTVEAVPGDQELRRLLAA
ncbi:hypothetical protein ID867_21095 [Streptomyces parvulus]|nr:hypothetical protein [Streptomyces parvulus]